MTNQNDPAYMRQVELEIEMSGLGRARFRSKVAKDIEGERGSSTKTGKALAQNCLIPLSEAITADSDVKPATIPIKNRPPFRFEAGRDSNQKPATFRH